MHTLSVLIEFARELRQQQTDAEIFLWRLLRNRQLLNAKFRRQHPIENYIADFYCDEHKLIIELDGCQHFTEEGVKKDVVRTARLNQLGIKVLRFSNQQVLTQTENVLREIALTLTLALSQRERGLDSLNF
jgi:very-short-patch-repair endonuclease